MTDLIQTRQNIRGIADISRVHAAAHGDTVAMMFEGQSTSYAALDERTSRIANGLAAEGLRAESRFALLGKNSNLFYELFFGGAKANAVLVAVNWRLSADEIVYIIDNSDSEILFVSTEFSGIAKEILPRLPKLRGIISLDAAFGEAPAFEDWLARQNAVDPMLPVRGDDVVLQLYTSGTTGLPKGAQLTNRSNMATFRHVDLGVFGKWDETTYSLAALPQFHIAGSGWGCYGLYAGGTVVIMREVNPVLMLELLSTMPIAKVGAVPAVLQIILDHPDCAKANFDALELISYGGSPISPALLRRCIEVFKCDFLQLFGMTESNAFGTFLAPADHDLNNPDLLLSCGRPAGIVQIRIIGPDGAVLPPGETGEILLKGEMVMKGYWKRPEATAEAIQDGWYHTGDVGMLDAQGYLYVKDRIKDMIISGGENIYSSEVENALASHPGVSEVAVIGVPDAKWGETVKAIVIRKPGAEVSAEELIAYARGKIAHYKCPRTVDFVAVLPRNAGGKVLKRNLRAPYWTESPAAVA